MNKIALWKPARFVCPCSVERKRNDFCWTIVQHYFGLQKKILLSCSITLACNNEFIASDIKRTKQTAKTNNNNIFSTNIGKSFGTLLHFCSICQGTLSVHMVPCLQFNVVYRDEIVIARFQHCRGVGGGGGAGFPIVLILLGYFFSKTACQPIFVLSAWIVGLYGWQLHFV